MAAHPPGVKPPGRDPGVDVPGNAGTVAPVGGAGTGTLRGTRTGARRTTTRIPPLAVAVPAAVGVLTVLTGTGQGWPVALDVAAGPAGATAGPLGELTRVLARVAGTAGESATRLTQWALVVAWIPVAATGAARWAVRTVGNRGTAVVVAATAAWAVPWVLVRAGAGQLWVCAGWAALWWAAHTRTVGRVIAGAVCGIGTPVMGPVLWAVGGRWAAAGWLPGAALWWLSTGFATDHGAQVPGRGPLAVLSGVGHFAAWRVPTGPVLVAATLWWVVAAAGWVSAARLGLPAPVGPATGLVAAVGLVATTGGWVGFAGMLRDPDRLVAAVWVLVVAGLVLAAARWARTTLVAVAVAAAVSVTAIGVPGPGSWVPDPDAGRIAGTWSGRPVGLHPPYLAVSAVPGTWAREPLGDTVTNPLAGWIGTARWVVDRWGGVRLSHRVADPGTLDAVIEVRNRHWVVVPAGRDTPAEPGSGPGTAGHRAG